MTDYADEVSELLNQLHIEKRLLVVNRWVDMSHLRSMKISSNG